MIYDKIIFLDFDGVLNVCYPHRDKFGSLFHPHFELNLKRLIEETGAKIVISSSWRNNGFDEMKEMWAFRNLPGEVVDITPDFMERTGSTLQRGEEIAEWLSYNKTNNYVILDDDTDMLDGQLDNFVKCSDNINHSDCIDIGYGLTKECTDQAILILNNK